MNTTDRRGELNRTQVQQLLKPVNPNRVVTGQHVKPHLSQQDVVAHLIRVFGFGHFDVEVRESTLLFETATVNSGGKDAWAVGYRAMVRLTIRDDQQNIVAQYDGGSTGESTGQPSRADSHDLAFKSALSTATKRAAIHLGDQFGLSLYNKGQMSPLVKATMVGSTAAGDDVQDGVEQQEEDGGRVAERQDADAEQPQVATEAKPPRKRATNGTQGTRRKPAAEEQPQAAEEPAPADQGTRIADENGTHTQAPDGTVVEGSSQPWPEGSPLSTDGAPAPDPARYAQYQAEARPGISYALWLAGQEEREADAAAKRDGGRPDPDTIDRDDEQAVADYNATHGTATGSYITSNAERQRIAERPAQSQADAEAAEERRIRQEEADEQMRAQAEREAAEAFMQPTDAALAETHPTTGEVPEETPEQVDARIKAARAARAEEAPPAGDAPWDGEQVDWEAQLAAARTQGDCAVIWRKAQTAQQLTTELRVKIVARKDELPA